MKPIGISKFKEQCLALLEDLPPEGVVVTKHGKPVARVIPYSRDPRRLIGALGDKITIHGDLLSTGDTWDADAEP